MKPAGQMNLYSLVEKITMDTGLDYQEAMNCINTALLIDKAVYDALLASVRVIHDLKKRKQS